MKKKTTLPSPGMRLINRGYKCRVYPNTEQENFFARSFGCTRFIYNHYLDLRQTFYKEQKKNFGYNACSADLTLFKQQDGYEWLKDINSQSLQASLDHLNTSYKGFFEKRSKYPKFKKKHDKQSFTIPQNFYIKENLLFIPKLKTGIKIIKHREFEGKPTSLAISKTPSGEYYASFNFEVEVPIKGKVKASQQEITGLDAGLSTLITTSDGELIDNHKRHKQSEKKIAYLNRQLHKKQKGGSNRNKTRIKLAKVYQYDANSRKDTIHKISRRLVNENQVIIAETLNIKSMMQNHKLAAAISNAAWGELFRQIGYKADWDNKLFHQNSQWFASSKICFECKFKVDELPLNVREWKCPSCHHMNDRDVNAACNTKEEGIRELVAMGLLELTDQNCGVGDTSQDKQKLAEALEKDREQKILWPKSYKATVSQKISGSKKQEASAKSS